MTGRDVIAAIERGCLDPKIRAVAAQHYAASAQALGNDHSRKPGTIRASDAGRCVRELWAEIHQKSDIPQDSVTILSRFDMGTLYGAWLAALLKATLESEDKDRWRVECEVLIDRHNVTGHADAVIIEYGDAAKKLQRAVLTAEFKSTYGKSNKKPPSEDRFYQVAQVTHYALDKAHGSPMGTIITFAPAAWPAEDRLTFEDQEPEVYELRTEMEYERLAAALLDEMPEGDPDKPWRCEGCLFSECERNKNASQNTVSLA